MDLFRYKEIWEVFTAMIFPASKKKIGDILADLGKYVMTAVPVAYYVTKGNSFSFDIFLYSFLVGALLCIIGIYMINNAEKMEEALRRRQGKKHKLKLMRNAQFEIEKI